jgi:hypothetical protein
MLEPIQCRKHLTWWKPYRQGICVVKAAADGTSKTLVWLWTVIKILGFREKFIDISIR